MDFFAQYQDFFDQIHAVHNLRRILPSKPNPLIVFNEKEVFERFHSSKSTIEMIYNQIFIPEDFLGVKSCNLTPLHQLLLTLRFYSSGTHQIIIGDLLK